MQHIAVRCEFFLAFKRKLHQNSLEGDEVLWVRLVVMKHSIHGRVGECIHNAIVTLLTVSAFAKWRNLYVLMALRVAPSQHSGHYHEPGPISCWL